MADAITIVKAPNEALKDFNARLAQTCDESEVTNVQIAIVSLPLLWPKPWTF